MKTKNEVLTKDVQNICNELRAKKLNSRKSKPVIYAINKYTLQYDLIAKMNNIGTAHSVAETLNEHLNNADTIVYIVI